MPMFETQNLERTWVIRTRKGQDDKTVSTGCQSSLEGDCLNSDLARGRATVGGARSRPYGRNQGENVACQRWSGKSKPRCPRIDVPLSWAPVLWRSGGGSTFVAVPARSWAGLAIYSVTVLSFAPTHSERKGMFAWHLRRQSNVQFVFVLRPHQRLWVKPRRAAQLSGNMVTPGILWGIAQ
jgi:hypothetical protein